MDSLPKDTRIIIVRRGDNMRLMFPVVPARLYEVLPPELAEQAIRGFIDLQAQQPGRASMPITMDTPMGLVVPNSLFVLDPETNVGDQLEGRWEDMRVVTTEEDTPYLECPCTVLNLDDILD